MAPYQPVLLNLPTPSNNPKLHPSGKAHTPLHNHSSITHPVTLLCTSKKARHYHLLRLLHLFSHTEWQGEKDGQANAHWARIFCLNLFLLRNIPFWHHVQLCRRACLRWYMLMSWSTFALCQSWRNGQVEDWGIWHWGWYQCQCQRHSMWSGEWHRLIHQGSRRCLVRWRWSGGGGRTKWGGWRGSGVGMGYGGCCQALRELRWWWGSGLQVTAIHKVRWLSAKSVCCLTVILYPIALSPRIAEHTVIHDSLKPSPWIST